MKKLFIVSVAILLGIGIAGIVDAQEKKDEAAPASAAASKLPASAYKGPNRPNFVIIFGSVTKVDTTDPAKPRVEVKNESDGTTHVLDVTPWTSVTKVTDLAELKEGETVRVMARKAEDKEVAMTVVFGKVKNIYTPKAKPAAPAPAVAEAPKQ